MRLLVVWWQVNLFLFSCCGDNNRGDSEETQDPIGCFSGSVVAGDNGEEVAIQLVAQRQFRQGSEQRCDCTSRDSR